MMKKILLCEDEKDIQNSIMGMLSEKGYAVDVARDGQESIAKTKEVQPDLILLDIRMPKIDGIAVAKEIRKFNHQTKIIFITGFQSPQLAQEVTKYNIADYLVKPLTSQALLKAIEKALQ